MDLRSATRRNENGPRAVGSGSSMPRACALPSGSLTGADRGDVGRKGRAC
jgi:hypothetical protein